MINELAKKLRVLKQILYENSNVFYKNKVQIWINSVWKQTLSNNTEQIYTTQAEMLLYNINVHSILQICSNVSYKYETQYYVTNFIYWKVITVYFIT